MKTFFDEQFEYWGLKVAVVLLILMFIGLIGEILG